MIHTLTLVLALASTQPHFPSASSDLALPLAPQAVNVQAQADTVNGGRGNTVDGIPCEPNEQLAIHAHAYLALFNDGVPQLLPFGIGITRPPGADIPCAYWVHTHDASGIIHIEAPHAFAPTLGEFFDVWGKPLSANRVGDATGFVHAYVDGSPIEGDPAAIKLSDGMRIALDVTHSSKAPPTNDFVWPADGPSVLHLNTSAGNVTVRSWTSHMIDVRAYVHGGRTDAVRVESQASSRSISVFAVYRYLANWRDYPRVDYVVNIPASTSMVARTQNGDLVVDGLDSASATTMILTTAHGNACVDIHAGSVRLLGGTRVDATAAFIHDAARTLWSLGAGGAVISLRGNIGVAALRNGQRCHADVW